MAGIDVLDGERTYTLVNDARLQDILAVMTDRLHKSGFKMHATLLRHMFQLVETGQVTLELYDVAQHPNVTVSVDVWSIVSHGQGLEA